LSNTAYPTDAIRVAKALGVHITDESGRLFLDGCSGTFNVGLGYGHPAVIRAISSVLEEGMLHGSSILRTRHIDDAERQLVAIAPEGLDACHLKGSTGGSTAVEQAIRHAIKATGRRGIMVFDNGHHGQTLATSHLGSERSPTDNAFGVMHVKAPDCFRCPFGQDSRTCSRQCVQHVADAIDAATRANRKECPVAAMLAEPILGAGGGVVPPPGYWPAVAEILRERGILFIADEVQTFGRSGQFFGSVAAGITPDFIALAKSISGIGVPGAGAILLPSAQCEVPPLGRSLTSAGSSLACAAIVATLDVMSCEGFFEHTLRVADVIGDRLSRTKRRHGIVGWVRSCGLMAGLEIVRSKDNLEASPATASAIVKDCRSRGLIVRQSFKGSSAFIKLRPALTVSLSEAEEMCDLLEASIANVEERL